LEEGSVSQIHAAASEERLSDHEEQIEILLSGLSTVESSVSRLASEHKDSLAKVQGLIEEMKAQGGDSVIARIVSLDEFEIGHELSNAAHAPCCVSREKATGRKVQVQKWVDMDERRTTGFIRSVWIQSQLKCSGVLRLLGFGFTPGARPSGLMVEEFAEFGSFAGLIQKARLKWTLPAGVTATTFSKVIFGVSATMTQLHSLHIVHRDLQASNVFVNGRGEPLLGGFILSRFCSDSEEMTQMVGAPFSLAPENYSGEVETYGCSADVFAYALLLYSTFASEFKFASGTASSPHALMTWIVKGERYVRSPSIPDAFWALISECWAGDPGARPSFAEITRRMMNCDDFTLPGTNISEYHEYRNRILRETGVLSVFRSLGVDVDSIRGLHA
jgi:serine/threonine protein kinase